MEALADWLDERGRSQHRMTQLLGQVLKPRHLVDSAADDGEIQPLVGAYIAEHDFSHVQGNADLQRPAERMEFADILLGLARGAQRPLTHRDVLPGRSERNMP